MLWVTILIAMLCVKYMQNTMFTIYCITIIALLATGLMLL